MTNNNKIKNAEFKGEVIATLKFIREDQEEQKDNIKDFKKEIMDHLTEELKCVRELVHKNNIMAVRIKWFSGIFFAWISGITTYLVKKFGF